MVDWPPVIDADGHVLERQSDIRKYLEPPWNRRETALWPADQPFDTELFYASDIPHWDGEFPKNLEYLWNHPDLSRETKEKIAYHNGRTYFQLKRPASAHAARKAK